MRGAWVARKNVYTGRLFLTAASQTRPVPRLERFQGGLILLETANFMNLYFVSTVLKLVEKCPS